MIKKHMKRILIAAVIFILLVAGVGISLVISLKQYNESHTWVKLRIGGSVQTETSDAYEQTEEFLKGEAHQLHVTRVTIENISRDANNKRTVTLSFEPAVVNEAGETISQVQLKATEAISFTESCSGGESASGFIQVVNFRVE